MRIPLWLSRALWLSMASAFVVGCMIAPLWYWDTTPVYFYGDDSIVSDVGWFINDITFNTAYLIPALMMLIEDKPLRRGLGVIFIAEAIREFYDRRWWNNTFSWPSFVINNLVLLGGILYLWYKLKKT